MCRLQAGVRVALNHVELQIRIEHEVKAHQFEPIVVVADFPDQILASGFKGLSDALLDLRENNFIEIDATLFHQKVLEVLIGYLVSVFELAIVLTVFLHSIIREMNVFIMNGFKSEFLARGTKVAFLVKIPSKKLYWRTTQLRDIIIGKKAVNTEIKFPSRYQVWIRYVFL